ncbi:MAG: hypothetical protein HC773_11260, partial [Scytonema sp. CRU_2_7]|nr:hypothetical protein [Scytonema sp. CRU_2_7]
MFKLFLISLLLLLISTTPALAETELQRNERILSQYTSCEQAIQAGHYNLKTTVNFKPSKAKRSFDANKNGTSCEQPKKAKHADKPTANM